MKREATAQTGKLILVRHGESEGNRDRRFTTSSAAPLTDFGRRQAAEAAARIRLLYKPELVIASPYSRARETGEIIARELGLDTVIENDLREQSLGHLAGQPYESVAQDTTFDRSKPWLWCPPGGESRVQVRARVAPALDGIAARYPVHEIVVVSHGGVMAAIWAHVTDRWEGARVPPNAGIMVVEHVGGRYKPPQIIGEWDAGVVG